MDQQADYINLQRLSFERIERRAGFGFNGRLEGQPFTLSASLYVPLSEGDETPAEASKQALAQLLRHLADNL